MSLPEPILDDLRFQRDLVDEARLWVARRCPELTNFNLSNPLATFIELQAWNVEMLAYRMNQIPEKLYIRLLNMLGEDLAGPTPAKTDITFYLSAAFPLSDKDPNNSLTTIPQFTEVGSAPADTRKGSDAEVIFSTDKERTVRSAHIVAVHRKHEVDNHWPGLKKQQNSGYKFKAFGSKDDSLNANGTDLTVQQGDAFYIGLSLQPPKAPGDMAPAQPGDMSGFVVQLDFECETSGANIRRNDPPWLWQCLCQLPSGPGFAPVQLGRTASEQDTTGGLDNATGHVVVYLPQNAIPGKQLANLRVDTFAYWLRCSYEKQRTDQLGYQTSPIIKSIGVKVLGITVPATHARVATDEFLGISSGDPGQRFVMQHGPLLAEWGVDKTCALRVKEIPPLNRIRLNGNANEQIGEDWICQNDFAYSDEHDRHFVIDARTGEIAFGPNVLQRDGSARQYGRVPAFGNELRITQYRYGGGSAGNVPENTLCELRNSVPYIAYVTNWDAASGGQDAEDVQEAGLRLRREMWAKRAITADDIEQLAERATPIKLRAKCWPARKNGAGPSTNGTCMVYVLPKSIGQSNNHIQTQSLCLDKRRREEVQSYLDEHRMLTATIRVDHPRFLGVRVLATLQLDKYFSRQQAATDAEWLLRTWLAPINLLPPLLKNADSPLTAIARRFVQKFNGGTALPVWDKDHDWQGWPFGRIPKPTDVEELLRQLPGVTAVSEIHLQGKVLDKALDKGQVQVVLPISLPALDEAKLAQDPELHSVLACSLAGPELSHSIRTTGGSEAQNP